MMKSALALGYLAFTAMAAVCIADADAQHSSDERQLTLQHDGRQRTALVYVPASYTPSKPSPLILVFHGGGGNAANAQRTAQIDALADTRGLIVVYPNGTGVLKQTLLTWNTWNCCGYAMEHDIDDVGFVRALIETLKRRYAIDPNRIYATGLSNGAMMAHRLGCELSDQIAAIAPVAGALNAESCAPREPVSVVMFHGTADEHVLFEGGRNTKRFPGAKPRVDKPAEHAYSTWARLNKCSTPPTIRQNGSVRKLTCTNEATGAEVVLYAIEGQGHAWPGGKPGLRNGNIDPPSQEISATDVMVEFFLRHPRR